MTSGPALLERGMAEAVIRRALLGVLEALIGLADFPELHFAGRVARIAVGMELHGELAVSDLEVLVLAALDDAKNLVEIALRHLSR